MAKKVTLSMGGVLGLAGLGLLAQEVQAAPDGLPAAAPALGEAQAENPRALAVPAPTAAPTAPETEDLSDPQPVWGPSPDEEWVAAAASGQGLESEADAIAAIATSPAAATDAAASEVIDAVPKLSATPEAAPGIPPGGSSTDASFSSADGGDKVRFPAAPAAPQPDAFAATSPPPAARPTPAGGATSPEGDRTPVAAADRPQPPSPGAGRAAATSGAPSPGAVTPTTPPVTRDTASLRARATQIAALMQDIRAAAGLDGDPLDADVPGLGRQGASPQTPVREPQLPVLPGRSPRASKTPAPPSTTAAPAAPQLLPTARPLAHADAIAPDRQVALALPAPVPMLSPPAELAAGIPGSTAPVTAQAAPSPSGPQPSRIQEDLRIPPLTTAANPARTYVPSPNAGIPSAFGANWGDFFASASLAGADRLRPEADGSLSVGLGLGDSRQLVGLELAYNLLSVRNFGQNGSFDAKLHREVYAGDRTQVAAAVGVNNAFRYGSNTADTAASLYGVVTAAHLLQPDHPTNRLPITTTLGLGGGNFAAENTDVGVIAGLGLQVHPQLSVNTAWSGVGLNVGASILPDARIPLSLNLLYGDVGNNTRAGSVAVISIGYGYSSAPRF